MTLSVQMELHETITVCAIICVSHRTWSSVLKGDGTRSEAQGFHPRQLVMHVMDEIRGRFC